MNAGRRGRPFTCPDSLIKLLAFIRLLFHLPYRQLKGWRRKYGLRWIAESAFSWMERVFGEYITAKKLENMARR